MPMDLNGALETEEYLTDVAYVRHFVEDLSPENLRLVAALNGFAPPPGEDFDYCELGAGNGDTTATIAACHPHARVWGVDFNSEHMEFAKSLASTGQLENVRFLTKDFEDLVHEDLPQFDYITAFGVLSWVGPHKWKAVLEFAKKKLKPGGIFYASYNSMPGWAAIEPLRHLLVDTTRSVPGNSLDRARQGVELAKILAVGGASYFSSNPAATRMLETLMNARPNYVVHEYFHAHWRSMYFSDVAREMADHDLHFIGQLPLYLNYRDLTIPPALMNMFKMIDDRLVFEGLKDYVINEYFRRDVYIKGGQARSPGHTTRYFEEGRFGSLMVGSEIQREIRLPHHTLKYQGPVFDALIPALSKRSWTVAELVAEPSLAPYGAQTIRDSLRNLTLSGQVVAMGPSHASERLAEASLYAVPLIYNRMILQQPLLSRTSFVFASPVAGTGITMTLLEAIAMRLVTEVVPAMRKTWIHALIARDPLDMKAGGKKITDPGEQERILEEELLKFCSKKLPKLVELGILQPAEA